MVRNEHMLFFRLLDPRMVDNSIMFTGNVFKWATSTNLRAISLNVGVTTFAPPCISLFHQPGLRKFCPKPILQKNKLIGQLTNKLIMNCPVRSEVSVRVNISLGILPLAISDQGKIFCP